MSRKGLLPLILVMPLLTSCLDDHGDIDWLGTGLILCMLAPVLLYGCFEIIWHKSKRQKEKAIEVALANRKDFTESKVFRGKGGNSYYLATDDSRKKVFYVFDDKKQLFNYEDVARVEIIVDGAVTVAKTSLGGAIAGAFIGGAVTNSDSGALLGAYAFGITGSQTQVTSLKVHILLRNQPVPALDISCYETLGVAVPEISYVVDYREATDQAREIYDTFRLIIDRVDKEQRARNLKELKKAQKNSAVQELKELADLHSQGLLSEDEFTEMKRKIIENYGRADSLK